MSLFVPIALLFSPIFAAAREFDYRIILKGSRAEATAKGYLARSEDSALFSFSARAG